MMIFHQGSRKAHLRPLFEIEVLEDAREADTG